MEKAEVSNLKQLKQAKEHYENLLFKWITVAVGYFIFVLFLIFARKNELGLIILVSLFAVFILFFCFYWYWKHRKISKRINQLEKELVKLKKAVS